MSKPAARLSDMHTCPIVMPQPGPPPHVGGPILPPGAPTVLINGLAAARVGDMAVCVGPPDVIVAGSFTVLIAGQPAARLGDQTAHGGAIVAGSPNVMIGDSGGGAGGPPGMTMSAAKAAGAPFVRMNCESAGVVGGAASAAEFASVAPVTSHWIEIELVDQKGRPVAHERYHVVPPGGKPVEGYLDAAGLARIAGIDPGTCTISFPDLDAASWAPETGDPGRRTNPAVVDPKRPTDEPTLPSIQAANASLRALTWPSVEAAAVELRALRLPSIAAVVIGPRTAPEPTIGPADLVIRRVEFPSLGPVQHQIRKA